MLREGCICPSCYDQHGDRRRLALDHEANIHFRYTVLILTTLIRNPWTFFDAPFLPIFDLLIYSVFCYDKYILFKWFNFFTNKFRCANSSSSEMIKISAPKPRKGRRPKKKPDQTATLDPQIMRVWSCQDQAILKPAEVYEVDRNQLEVIFMKFYVLQKRRV